jgi:hypothetical protein
MPGKAFLLGRNGDDKLRWCCNFDADGRLLPCDVQHMRDALRQREYEVDVAKESWSKGEILDALNEALGCTADGETFIFYFSGHAKPTGDDLCLVLGSTAGSRTDCLRASWVIQLLNDCPATYKLIVLDCCYAGEASSSWQPGVHENLRILAATDRLTPGKESGQLEGGIFSYCLYQALTDQAYWVRGAAGLVDDDGVIWSDRLSGWLKRRVRMEAERHGIDAGDPVEYIGSDKHRVRIARVEPRDPLPSSAGIDLDGLERLLAAAKLDLGGIRACFDDLLDKIDPPLRSQRPDPAANTRALLDYLCATLVRADANIPAALPELVAVLADQAADPTSLRSWAEEICARQVAAGALSQAQADRLGASRKIKRAGALGTFLMVTPGRPEGNDTFSGGGAWLSDRGRESESLARADQDMIAAELPALLFKGLLDGRAKDAMHAGRTLTVELFLPLELIDLDADTWRPGNGLRGAAGYPTACDHHLVVRLWERTDPAGPEEWKRSWDKCGPSADRTPGSGCVAFLSRDRVAYYKRRLDAGKCLFLMELVPRRQDLERPLERGVTRLLWCSEPWSPRVRTQLDQDLAQRPLRDLPDILRCIRADLWDETETHTGHLHLLWDDPSHTLPADDGEDDPLVDPYRHFST